MTRHDTSGAGSSPAPEASALTPYVPRLVVDWLRDESELAHRQVDGTLAFVDISGFTALTEKLARRGKAGAEEISDVLNLVFEQLLAAAYDYGAGLVKWGGDAVLLLFDEAGHTERACRAVLEMQRTIRRVGRLRTSAGSVTLSMSVGVHTDVFDFFLVGDRHRELVVTGRGASTVAAMEKVAGAGEVVVSADTAARIRALVPDALGDARADGFLLLRAPDVGLQPNRRAKSLAGLDLGRAMCRTLREHLLAGGSADEHRAITVAFVEFSGVDALIETHGAEEASVALDELIASVQEIADRHDVTFLATDVNADGGKIILVSGAPRRAGDDEARVLTTVREILDAPHVLRLRAGATSGRVFAGDFGPFYRKTYSIAGDCVNLAARLMARAATGTFVVMPDVLERSRTAFAVRALEPFLVKGKKEPILALEVGALERDPSAPVTDGSALPLVGRDEELAALSHAFEGARAGHGRVVEIIGDAGMGKSRLVDELLARTDNADVLWARGDVYGTSTPYQPLQRLLREQLGIADDAEPGTLEHTLVRLVAGLAPRLLPWLPLIGMVAGVELPSTPEVDAIDGAFRKARLEAATSEVLGHVLTRPTIFFFDDAHFMDDASLGLLRQLCEDVAARPWLLIVTRRPSMDPPVPESDFVRRLPLSPLTTDAAQQLVTLATADAPLTAHRLAAVADRAAGNPLFLRELVTGAAATEDLDALPDSVEGVIAARVDRLPPDKRTLLRVAAVLGMRVELDQLQALLAPEGIALTTADIRALDEFVERVPGKVLAFKHNLVREVAYEGLPFRRRAVFHGRAGDLLESTTAHPEDEIPELLSVHYLCAERYPAAWRYAGIAGRRAVARYAPADATPFFERALAASRHLPDVPTDEVAEILEALGDARFVLGEMPQARAAFDDARGRATEPVRIARLRMKTSRVCERSSELAQALRWITRGLRAVEGQDDDAARRIHALLTGRYARVRFSQGRYTDAIRWSHRAIDEAEQCGDRDALARALEFLDVALVASGDTSGDAPSARALDIYVELGDWLGQGHANNDLGIRAFYQGRWLDAHAHYDASRAAFERAGALWDAAMEYANIAELLLHWDRGDEAEPLLLQAMRTWTAAGARPELAFGQEMLGQVAMRDGRYDEAFALLEEAHTFLAHSGNSAVLRLRGLIAETHVRAGAAQTGLDLATAALAETGDASGGAVFVPLLERVRGFALRDLDDLAAARGAYERSVEAARTIGAEHEVAFGLEALIDVAPRDPARPTWAAEHARLVTQLGMVVHADAPVASTSDSTGVVVDLAEPTVAATG